MQIRMVCMQFENPPLVISYDFIRDTLIYKFRGSVLKSLPGFLHD